MAAYFKGKKLLLVGLKGNVGPVGPVGPQGKTGDKGDTGNSGVYVGSGDMPADCNVQIDPDADVVNISDIAAEAADLIKDVLLNEVNSPEYKESIAGADGLVVREDDDGINRLYLTKNGEIISTGIVIPQGGDDSGSDSVPVEIPVYDLTALGVPTIIVGGDPLSIEFDTTNLKNDLANGEITIKGKFDIGDGYPMELVRTCRASFVDGSVYVITSIDDMMGSLIISTFMVMPGMITINVYPYSNSVNQMIDEYMESALGGEY